MNHPRRVIDKVALVLLGAGLEADVALKLSDQDNFDKG